MSKAQFQDFTIEVSRTYVHTATITVSANSIEMARAMALDLIDDTTLSIDCAIENDDRADGFSVGQVYEAIKSL